MTRQNLYILSFCLLSALVPIIVVDMPHGVAFAPGIIGIVFYALYFVVFNTKPDFSKRTLWLTLIIFGLSSSSLLWALHFEVSLKQVGKLAFLLPPQILLISLVKSLNKEQLKGYIHLFPYGVVFASLYLCFEIITGGIVFNLIRGEPLNIAADPDEFNRAAVTLSLYSFAALSLLKTRIKNSLYFLPIILPLFTALILSESQSGQLSFIVGAAFLFLFPYQSKLMWSALKITFLVLMFCAPFVISTIYQNYADDIEHIPGMSRAYAGHRLEVWDYISRYALQEPVHGYGIEATRATKDFDSGRIFDNSNTILHPHNFAIQIWVEFGAIGILIAMALIYILFFTIQSQFTPSQQKIILPTFMAAMVPASFAFGLWQGWWLALLFHLAAICLISCKFAYEEPTE